MRSLVFPTRLLASSVALSLLGGPLAAQEPSPLFAEAVDVELVNVEVFVNGRDGEPLTGLGRDDFRVFEDGKPVEVSHFAWIPGGAVPEGEPAPETQGATPKAPGRIVLYVDNVHVEPLLRNQALSDLFEMVEQRLGARDEVLVAVYDGRLRIALPFSSDREALRATLRELLAVPLSPPVLQLEARRTIGMIQEMQRSEGGEPAADAATGICINLGGIARNHAEQMHGHEKQAISALSVFVRSLGAIPGRKVLVHLSSGLPLVAGADVYDYAVELCDGSGARKGLAFSTDVTGLGDAQRDRWDPFTARADRQQYDLSDEWRQVATEANAAEVTFYPLQTSSGAVDVGFTSAYAATAADSELQNLRNRQDTLSLLATETGGRAFFDTIRAKEVGATILAETGHYYLLSYRPPDAAPRRARRIRVEADVPGARVRHRAGYRLRDPEEVIYDGLWSAFLLRRENNPLGVSAELGPATSPPGGGAAVTRIGGPPAAGSPLVRVRMRVPLDRLTLLPVGPSRQGMFTVYVTYSDATGGAGPVGKRSLPVWVSDQPGQTPREFVYEVDVPAARGGAVALAVRDEMSGAVSFLHELVGS